MPLKITHKRWNNPKDQIITHVKVEDKDVYQMITIWNWINTNKYEFYTLEKGIRAKVYALINSSATKYITTSPDGTTHNNLDDLPGC